VARARADAVSGPPPRTGPRWSTRQRLVALGVLNVFLLAVLGIVVAGKAAGGKDDKPVAAPSATTVLTTPWEKATDALRLSADALVAGDVNGWMAAVDPSQPELQTRYRAVYQELHTLGVTAFTYIPGIYSADPSDPETVDFPATADYCFGADTCRDDLDKPQIASIWS